MSPDTGRPGDGFTVSGENCLFPDPPTASSFPTDFDAQATGAPVNVAVAFPSALSASTNADSAGNWSVSFTVPAGTPPGVYDVDADCLNTPEPAPAPASADDVRAQDFSYPTGTYTVPADPTPGTPTTTPGVAGVIESAPADPAPPVAAAPTFTG